MSGLPLLCPSFVLNVDVCTAAGIVPNVSPHDGVWPWWPSLRSSLAPGRRTWCLRWLARRWDGRCYNGSDRFIGVVVFDMEERAVAEESVSSDAFSGHNVLFTSSSVNMSCQRRTFRYASGRSQDCCARGIEADHVVTYITCICTTVRLCPQ